MPNLNPDIPTAELTAALDETMQAMQAFGQTVLTPELLLLTFARAEPYNASRLLRLLSRERGFDLAEFTRTVEQMAKLRKGRDGQLNFMSTSGRPIPLSDEMLVALDEGRGIAQALDEVQVGTHHVLGAMSERGVSVSAFLQRHGVTPAAMTDQLMAEAQIQRNTANDLAAQAQAGEMRPLHYRQDLLRDLSTLLALAGSRHILLIGQPGVGRRSLARSLALLMAEGKGPAGLKSLVEINEGALLTDPVKALQAGLRQATGGILFVPNIERFFGGVLDAIFPKAERPLQKAFLESDPVIIGSTTQAAFDKLIAKSPAVVENANLLPVPEPGVEETAAILAVHRPHLEAEYGLSIKASSTITAANLAKRYLTETPLPASALQLLHRSAALVRAGKQAQNPFRPQVGDGATLDDEDIALALSLLTGIPVTRLGVDERAKYARMVEAIRERIIGQDEAVLAISRAVKTARVGLKDPKRPIGSFLFLGPTGVGKTELSKALAEFMFGSEEALFELDMSEYQQEHAVARLIGAPPGYVGYEGGGQLTDHVRSKPYTIVLFDEVEKAHPRVLDVLLQVMEEGRLTDGQGRTAYFNEAVVIMTSNLGSEHLTEPLVSEHHRELVMASVQRFFRPEFLNRLDDIVIFSALSPENLRQILGLMLKKEQKLLQGRGLGLEVSDAAQTWLLAQNDHPEWGARPLRRIIQRNLREPLADYLLAHDPAAGTVVRVDANAEGLVFDIG
ncbi:MAG: ATP-dependent Clp protease ATP-binding subunit [Caldilineales bacterium]|nr:ATP-dependent Clp protease ATP-binding subunit [Caldilineales bacterium]